MISTFFTKYKMYAAIGLLFLIIGLLVAFGIQTARVNKLESKVDKLETENQRFEKEVAFLKVQIKIQADFTNSTAAIESITNKTIFDTKCQPY